MSSTNTSDPPTLDTASAACWNARAVFEAARIIYEARPNVTSDAAALCLKAGNACILRGGSEALHSNQAIAACVRAGLKAAGLPPLPIHGARHTYATIALTSGVPIALFLVDQRMPGMTGPQLRDLMAARNISLPVVFLTGHGDVPMSVDAMKKGAVDFLQKPVNDEALLQAIGRPELLDDPRFAPLAPDEHPGLVLSVSVLTPFAPVPGAESIVPGRDGVVLEAQGRRALFLPEVAAEEGWTRLELLEHLCKKAGLPKSAWQGARLSTVQSERFGEPEGETARIRRS